MNNTLFSKYHLNPQSFLDKLSMIVACSKNGMIGKDNKLLWHLPNDLKRFKQLTTNKIVVMGRKTYDSLPKGALPGRMNIILCNDDKKFLEEPIQITTSNTGVIKLENIEQVFNFIYDFEINNPTMKNINTDEVFIIGGGAIYNLFLPFINKLYLTFVDVQIDGDTKLPDITKYEWDEIESIDNQKDEKHEYDYTFLTLKK